MKEKENILLTKSQLAELFQVSTRTIDRWIARGVDIGKVRLPGGNYRFDRKKVDASIASGIIGIKR